MLFALTISYWGLLFSFPLRKLRLWLGACAFPGQFRFSEPSRTGVGRQAAGGRRARTFLAAGEIALAMVLLAASGLLLRSFSKLMSVNPGFDVQHVVKANLSASISIFDSPAVDRLLRQTAGTNAG